MTQPGPVTQVSFWFSPCWCDSVCSHYHLNLTRCPWWFYPVSLICNQTKRMIFDSAWNCCAGPLWFLQLFSSSAVISDSCWSQLEKHLCQNEPSRNHMEVQLTCDRRVLGPGGLRTFTEHFNSLIINQNVSIFSERFLNILNWTCYVYQRPRPHTPPTGLWGVASGAEPGIYAPQWSQWSLQFPV